MTLNFDVQIGGGGRGWKHENTISDVDQVLHYASVDARKRLEPGVAGERYKNMLVVCTGLQCVCILQQ